MQLVLLSFVLGSEDGPMPLQAIRAQGMFFVFDFGDYRALLKGFGVIQGRFRVAAMTM